MLPATDPRRCFVRSGIREAAESAGATVLLPREDDFVEVDLGGQLLTTWPVLKHFIETDRLINMPIVKQHSLSACTIGMKNLYGILGGSRHRLHQQIDQSIVDLTRFCMPTLTVVDATRVLLRGGPAGRIARRRTGGHTVLCATDPVAADSRRMRAARPARRPGRTHRAGRQSGLGCLTTPPPATKRSRHDHQDGPQSSPGQPSKRSSAFSSGLILKTTFEVDFNPRRGARSPCHIRCLSRSSLIP